ncbi:MULTISPECIES: DUF1515 family protein [Rhizobium]|uniref:DUF1515 family protein n=1 Tax=Rhizobium TaxID=379 RepID=UPI0022AA7B9D|nr:MULTISPECIES: DUF1515 family protein [Rhizobium]
MTRSRAAVTPLSSSRSWRRPGYPVYHAGALDVIGFGGMALAVSFAGALKRIAAILLGRWSFPLATKTSFRPMRSSCYGTVQFHFREAPLLSGLTPEGP